MSALSTAGVAQALADYHTDLRIEQFGGYPAKFAVIGDRWVVVSSVVDGSLEPDLAVYDTQDPDFVSWVTAARELLSSEPGDWSMASALMECA